MANMKSSVPAPAEGVEQLLTWLRANTRWQPLLQTMVEYESPSHDKAAVDEFGRFLSKHFERLGGTIQWHRQTHFGDIMEVEFIGVSRRRPLLLLGHLDTVHEKGVVRTMPARVDRGKMYGPGVFDMKGGIVQALLAIEVLQQVYGGLPRPVTVLLNPDEEIGSPVSRATTERLAKNCDAVLVLEPAAGPNGACKTGRKGVGNYKVRVRGVSAHAGLDFENGVSAVTELAQQLLKISEFTDLAKGTTVNAGIIRGGTRTNVVPDLAEVDIDLRVTSQKEAERLDKKFRSLKPVDKRCKVEVSGGMNRAPFERTPKVLALYQQAKELAAEIGFELEERSVGGGSDGNFTAGLGIPTLDGLGAVGEGAHAAHENIILSEVPRRAALLARLLETL